jgi:oxepin-CoA hydrolase/3-oxo-5,6-dehydrosuberyl-CoA semialdehyde dehydrogenase
VAGNGAFMSPIVMRTDDPLGSDGVHDIEAFGPVSTIMPYKDLDDAVKLANRGMGSLALSLFTYAPDVAEEFVMGAGAYHGRMLILDRTSAGNRPATALPLPVLVHGGPGRAGGGEEMGGVRGVAHYMQRTALQGSPALLSHIVKQWLPGAEKPKARCTRSASASPSWSRLHAQDCKAAP